jgi:hypothetical protein
MTAAVLQSADTSSKLFIYFYLVRGNYQTKNPGFRRGNLMPLRGKAGDEIRTHDIHVGNVTLYH